MNRTIVISAFLCVALSASGAHAQTTGTDLAGLTLEQLMDMRVISTTKMGSMPIDKAPGVIRVFTRADIERFGFVTLRDVLANVPGVQIQEFRGGHQAVWFRGIKERYNNKVLWLVDGVPIRDSYYGHQSIDEVLPLDMVERVEIITGPGSVLYGTNAFAGVVSITTKSSRSRGVRNVRAAYGNYETGTVSAEGAAGPAYGLVNQLKTSGFSPRLNNDGQAWQHDQGRTRTYGLFKVGGEHLEATLSLTDHQYVDTNRPSGQDRSITRSPVYGAARYEHDLPQNVSLSVLGYVEYYGIAKTDVRFSAPGVARTITDEHYNTSLQGVDVNLSRRVGRHVLVGGAAWQMDRSHKMTHDEVFPSHTSEPQMLVPAVSHQGVGMFIQDVWSLGPSVDITSGVRYDVLSAFNDEFSYRTALAANHGRAYGKVLFGTAFRVPSYREYLDLNSHNLALRPEHVDTFEAQAGHRSRLADVNVTFFNNAYRDLIKEILVATIATPSGIRTLGGDEYSINADRSTIRGIEFQAQTRPSQRMDVTVGVSRLISATETMGALDSSVTPSHPVSPGTIDAEFLAKYTANALVDYRLTMRGDRIGLHAEGLSRRVVPADYQNDVPTENRDLSNTAGFVRVDAFATIRVLPRARVDLKALNLFDRTIFSPSFDNVTGYDTQWQGRSFRIQLTVTY
jgi:outer membrane receptor protein involved in Fe transport